MAKKRKKTKNDGSNVTRRDILKGAGAAGATAALGPIMLTSRKAFAFQDNTDGNIEYPTPPPDGGTGSAGEPVLCALPAPPSPPTRPFVDFLRVPPTAQRTSLMPRPTKDANLSGGEAARVPHQRWEEFLPKAEYSMNAKASTHLFHSDFQPTYIWGFNGIYPAPTPRINYGEPAIVRFKNSLPAQTTTIGRNEITVHLHNGHTASESDGFAGDFFGRNLFKDNHYANAYAGIDAFGSSGGVRGNPLEAMHTFWFHDHRAAFTANNNLLGLNGMYILYDKTDPGHQDNTAGSLRLPGIYGLTDLPLILTDKRFCATANGRTEMVNQIGGGDKWIVNGRIQPRMSVRKKKYRFRILNTGPTKTWTLRVVGPNGAQVPWTVVAVDANFLRNPWVISNTDLTVFVASRYDVIIDFKQFPVGSKVYLRENAPQNVGMPAPEPLPAGLAIENVLMRFDVVGEPVIPDTPPIPNTLVNLPAIPTPSACHQWRFTLEPPPGSPAGTPSQFLINEQPFDANRVDHVVLKGSTEEWELKNDVLAGNWTHPVHIHFEEGRVTERTVRVDVGLPTERTVVQTLLPDEDANNARRDVYPLPGQNSVKLKMQFRDFVGRYLIHCHNMGHEDNFMMVRWDIVATKAEYDAKKAEILQRRAAAGLPNVPCGQRRP
jgi:FtsP/CotA-like multicopper oxidase with cupredoxin domain